MGKKIKNIFNKVRSVVRFFVPDLFSGVQLENATPYSCIVSDDGVVSNVVISHQFYTLRSMVAHYKHEFFKNIPRIEKVRALQPALSNMLGAQLGFSERGFYLAIAYDAANGGSASGSTITISHTVASGSNRLMLASHAGQGNTGMNSGVFNTSENLSSVASNTNAPYTGIWKLLAPSVTTANVVLTMSGGGAHAGCVVTLTGVDQTTPIGTTKATVAGTGTSSSNTMTTAYANSMIVDALAIDSSGSTQTPTTSGTNQTKRVQATPSSFNEGAFSTQTTTTAGSYTTSWSWGASKQYSQTAVEVVEVQSTAWTATLTETITITDVLSKVTSRTLTQAITFTEGLLHSTARTLTEAITFVDVIESIKLLSTVLTDSFVVVDVVNRTVARSLADAISFADVVARTTARTLADVIVPVDVFTNSIALGRVFSEVVTITDTLLTFLNGLIPRWATKYTSPFRDWTTKF